MLDFTFFNNPTLPFRRLLKDSEIIEAIKRKFILLDDPDEYLVRQRDKLVQPASMDVLMHGIDDVLYESAMRIDGMEPISIVAPHHPDVSDDFVTFWPGYITETLMKHLKGFYSELAPKAELRSTLRRIGLDIGPGAVGIDSDGYAFLSVRNPQAYPISVEKGLKIAQILWADRGFVAYLGGYEDRGGVKLGSGKLVMEKRELQELVDSGDLFVSDPNSIGDGVVLFHAGRIRTYCNQGHVILDSTGVHGFDTGKNDSANHTIYPGEFSNIETIERIGLSGRVALQAFYTFDFNWEDSSLTQMMDRCNTIFSSGGWVDPGYGMEVPGGASFSVQRKAFTRPIRIKEGELAAYGVVWVFPEPVEKMYSKERGSHYSQAREYVAPKI